ncbi:4-alpha-glucanotransferase [uncultured Roseibium sp.]|uniref:4-alpha-glucanotransferase n=1 Tax=uncultured Roseibium sp. TaxID=1936171 RepID=UPI0026028089|nr:4-alpha-glucanotransferase [uncultured Roseibium sp.]
MSDGLLQQLAEENGVLPYFHDLGGHEYRTGPDTQRAMLRAMGVAAESDADARMSLDALRLERERHLVSPEFVVTAGHDAGIPVRHGCDWVLTDDTGREVAVGFSEDQVHLPPLEVGVHHLRVSNGEIEQVALIPAAPAQTPSLVSITGRERVWGITAALYGLRSGRNFGLGDYGDLADLAQTLGSAGASFLGINPIHNWGWSTTDIASPYSPSHRGFLNTLHIALDQIPGLAGNQSAGELVEKVRADVAPDAQLIDYQNIRQRLQSPLKALFDLFNAVGSDDAKERHQRFVQAGGEDLLQFAIFEALAGQHGENWHSWPEELKDPTSVPRGAWDDREPRFHMWLQWVASEQLDRVSREHAMPLGLYLDLAVGARRDGAEAWMDQDSVAKGVSLGAPPDHLSPEGQNWQLTAFAPSLSAKGGYRNLRAILRQTMRSAGMIRIDHVLGLNRSFWIPDDGSPGAYVQQPFETLIALVGIEAHKAQCVVVGEDLGLVPDGFREALSARGIYGYSVLQYEKEWDGSFRDPSHLRAHNLACFATHDTPTLHGFCVGRDIDWWRKLGWIDDESAAHSREERKKNVAELVPEDRAPGPAIHGRLAHSPAVMASVQLDDILGEEEAQNLPGTIDEHSNWRRIYRVAVDTLGESPALYETADLMRTAGRAAFYPDGEN